MTFSLLKDRYKFPSANTDNKRHLFVTVFKHPAFYIMTLISLNPDTAPVLTIKLCVSWQILGSVACLYRDTAPVSIYFAPIEWQIINHLFQLYRDTRISQKVCNMHQKPRHGRLAPWLNPG